MKESLTGASLRSAAVYASLHSHWTHIIKHIHINMYLKLLTFILKQTLRKHVFHYGKLVYPQGWTEIGPKLNQDKHQDSMEKRCYARPGFRVKTETELKNSVLMATKKRQTENKQSGFKLYRFCVFTVFTAISPFVP